jgi:hypothetical protein
LFPETVKDYKALFINYGDNEALRQKAIKKPLAGIKQNCTRHAKVKKFQHADKRSIPGNHWGR